MARSLRGVVLYDSIQYMYRDREKCKEYNRKYYRAHWKQEKERKAKERAEALANGLCGRCRKRPRETSISICSWCVKRMRAVDRRMHVRNKAECISAYGGKCACCGEGRLEFLTIDHPNNDGAEHRRPKAKMREGIKRTGAGVHIYRYLRKNGFPKEFRLLCWNCNCSRGFSGYCPHERERVDATRAAASS